ncbi:uncharacterized protein BDR25DRAFT_306133 [Lindgomyces ingoldianus]|uniref:Uncharacterized protein n=1 Tax=Lindgomyces ingoldianus TaxID=673940 RepID=A0ACB6QH86_9PLEO|nr:uncharacterized protein BDR25DRAFT_306133 [Lindgomyces ingoldianus]KAF2466284.1 hypothetical protein BDR25DRAFT_306133 [Lindgomyces ingoldianus]
MPVTTRAAPVEVKFAPELKGLNATSILQASCPNQWDTSSSLLDSSFGNNEAIQANQNGFVKTVLDAYLQHNHLVLRPEDVWFAILIQFNFYVNKHSEKLRKFFVEHQGKKKLEILQTPPMDLAAFALAMTGLIAANIKDPALREWIMPSFSTTTNTDKVTAAIIMMGTMQKYFAFFLGITCGIPSVTLMGEREDWENIMDRIDFLCKFGDEHEELLLWNSVLKSVVSRFVQTFDAPDSPEVVQFWQKTVHQHTNSYSGEKQITGWILAFCFWETEGNPLIARAIGRRSPPWREGVKSDGLEYWLENNRLGQLDWNDVPAGYAHVPVHIKEYGSGEKYLTTAIAGSVGWRVLDSDLIFAETRGENKAKAKARPRQPRLPILQLGRQGNTSGPSTYTGSTLKEDTKRSGILSKIQKVFCFKPKDEDNSGENTAPSKLTPINAAPAKVDQPQKEESYFQRMFLEERMDIVPQISDLSELSQPWEYEAGGKRDTLQPVTGWWVVKSKAGVYGKDPDCPDIQFDSDAEDYNDDLARNGRPLY